MKVKKLFESVTFGKIITGKIKDFFSFQKILIFTQGFSIIFKHLYFYFGFHGLFQCRYLDSFT